jgi:hypothetical protein
VNADKLWTTGRCEISDLLTLKTAHPGGGGFDTDFYVEDPLHRRTGVCRRRRLLRPEHPIEVDVTEGELHDEPSFDEDRPVMSQGAPASRMHGLTHVAGGPDPVPGLLPSPPGDFIDPVLPSGGGALLARRRSGRRPHRVGSWTWPATRTHSTGYPATGTDPADDAGG